MFICSDTIELKVRLVLHPEVPYSRKTLTFIPQLTSIDPERRFLTPVI